VQSTVTTCAFHVPNITPITCSKKSRFSY